MANLKDTGRRYKDAIVDTAPGADGFATNIVKGSTKGSGYLVFSVRGMGDATVTLQFKGLGDSSWTDLKTYITNDRELLEGSGNGVEWRAIIKDTNYTSGTIKFGFDW